MANRKKGGAAHRSFLALPRLRAGHGLQAPVTSQWTENDRALALISRSIDVLNSAEKGHSIPDIFSQSIQFEFDLGIGNARAVEQWQGLLATLLLAGAGGQARVRPLDMDALGDAPFARIFRAVAARRGIEGMTLFELRRTDGSWGAVAFRFAGMPTMLCPAAEIRGPFVVDDPWLRQTERGWTFDAPLALVDDPRYGERRLALRNEIYALATREIPARENRDGLQMIRLRAFFEFLSRGGDGISPYPVNAEVRAALFTQDAAAARRVRRCLRTESACCGKGMHTTASMPARWKPCASSPVRRTADGGRCCRCGAPLPSGSWTSCARGRCACGCAGITARWRRSCRTRATACSNPACTASRTWSTTPATATRRRRRSGRPKRWRAGIAIISCATTTATRCPWPCRRWK